MSGVLQLLFGSTDVTALLYAGSVAFSKSINQRWSCSFTLLDLTGTNRQTVGQPFTLKEDGTVRFSGYIDEIEEQPYEGSLIANQYHCKCSSWASVCDHRVVTKVYEAGDPANTVILDIVATFLSGEGVTTVHVNCPGSITAPLALQPVTVTQAFDTVRDMCGGQWWVDENRDLHFSAVGSGSALGWSLTDTTVNEDWLAGSARVTRTTKDFRNVQYLVSTSSLGNSTSAETTVVSSPLQFFIPTREPIATAPTVTIGGVAQTVVQWLDASGNVVTPMGSNAWYWAPGLAGVQQGQQIPPAIGATVVVTYDHPNPVQNYVEEEDAGSIAARAAIEGTSGRWEQVTQVPKIDDPAVAQAYAQGLLARSDVIPVVVQIDTYRSDYVVGSKQTVNLTQHGVNATLTVQQIQAKEIPYMQGPVSGQTFKYTVQLSNAQAIGNYVKWTEGLVRAIGAAATPATTSTPAPSLTPDLDEAIATFNFDLTDTGLHLADTTNRNVEKVPFALTTWVAACDSPSAGSSVILDVFNDAGISLLDTSRIVIPAGAAGVVSGSNFQIPSYSDLVVGSTTTEISSAAYPFGTKQVGNQIKITAGTGFTTGTYTIQSVSGGVATLDRSAGTAGSVSGAGQINGMQTLTGKVIQPGSTPATRVQVKLYGRRVSS